MNKKSIFNLLKVMFSLIVMIFVIYYFFGKNSDKLQKDLLTVEYKYIIFSMIFGAWAYVNRGLRWIYLINALGFTTSKTNAVSAVSVGYFTNLFIPRAGEISRCTSLKKTNNIPVDKLFGTILVERVIDFVFLMFGLLIVIFIKSGEIIKSINEYQKIDDQSPSNSKFIILFSILCIFLIFYLLRKRIKKLSFYQKIKDFIVGLKEGFNSIKKIKNKSLFWFHTLSIWTMYFLMTYICFQAIPETSNLGISDGIFLLILGGIGMVIPAPGGIGSYHLIVMIGLVALQIPEGFLSLKPYNNYNPAMLFPFIVHTAQTFVAIIMGSIGLLMLFMNKKIN